MVPALLAAGLMLGCDGGEIDPGDDAGGSLDGATLREDAGHRDTGPGGGDAGPPAPDAGPVGPACEPAPGPAMNDAYCDLFELAIFDAGTAGAEARLYGRLSPNGHVDGTCATVDSVEVQEGGARIGELPGVGGYTVGSESAILARGDVLPEMASRCAGDEDRFGGFGFIIRGRVDGGTFEARCADAEGGGRWPPALVVTCHENVDEPSAFGTYAMVETPVPGIVLTSVDVSMPHGPGGAILDVDDTARVIPHVDPFGGGVAPPPFDVTGWSTSATESTAPAPGVHTQVSFWTMSDVFGPELCPTPPVDPGPDFDPAPVMLFRFSGTSEHGAFSSETLVDDCARIPPRM